MQTPRLLYQQCLYEVESEKGKTDFSGCKPTFCCHDTVSRYTLPYSQAKEQLRVLLQGLKIDPLKRTTALARADPPLFECWNCIGWFRHSRAGFSLLLSHRFRAWFPVKKKKMISDLWTFWLSSSARNETSARLHSVTNMSVRNVLYEKRKQLSVVYIPVCVKPSWQKMNIQHSTASARESIVAISKPCFSIWHFPKTILQEDLILDLNNSLRPYKHLLGFVVMSLSVLRCGEQPKHCTDPAEM